MDARSYCDSIGHELAGLKAKLYDAMRKADKMAGAQKEKVTPLISELNGVMDDLDTRIARLASECPAEFSSDQETIEGGISKAKAGWKKVYGVMGEDEYGVGGA